MWLHALNGMDEQSQSLEVNRSVLGDDAALDPTSWPELVVHFSPWMRRIRSERTGSVLAHHEAWCYLSELEIHVRILARRRLDLIAFSILADAHGAVISLEVLSVFGEVEVV